MIVFHEPRPEDFRTAGDYHDAVVRYWRYIGAKYVWAQISVDERLWILRELGFSDPSAMLMRDPANDLSGLRMTRTQLNFIFYYPTTQHRREVYEEILARTPSVQDQRVRRNEERLRAIPDEFSKLSGEPSGTSHPMPFEYDARYYTESDLPMRRVHVNQHKRRLK